MPCHGRFVVPGRGRGEGGKWWSGRSRGRRLDVHTRCMATRRNAAHGAGFALYNIEVTPNEVETLLDYIDSVLAHCRGDWCGYVVHIGRGKNAFGMGVMEGDFKNKDKKDTEHAATLLDPMGDKATARDDRALPQRRGL